MSTKISELSKHTIKKQRKKKQREYLLEEKRKRGERIKFKNDY